MNNRIFLVLILLPFLTSSSFHTSTEQGNMLERSLLGSLTVQDDLVKLIHEGIETPVQVANDSTGLFVVNFGDMHVAQYNDEGSKIRTFGFGQGNDPGNLNNITDFVVGENELIVVDGNGRNVSLFDRDGTFITRHYIGPYPSRVARVGKEKDNMVVLGIGSEKLFKTLDWSGTVINEFGVLMEDQVSNPLSMTGQLIETEDGGFIYVPAYASFLFYFDSKGKLEKKVWTVDGLNFPTSESLDGIRYDRPKPPVVVWGSSIDEAIIHLQSSNKGFDNLTGAKVIRNYLDSYDALEGTYLGSLEIPFPGNDASVFNRKLYVPADTAVYVFDLSQYLSDLKAP